LGGADEIFAGENNGKGAELNRRGLGKAHRLSSLYDFRGESEVIERHAER
jgi:hypothetical protein